MTDWHLVHHGQYALHGAGLVICEATSVTESGRVSTGCAGLWKDDQIPSMKRVTEFVHSQGGKIGLQIGHSGRKGSTHPPFLVKSREVASPEEGGWNDVVASTSEPWDDNLLIPLEISQDGIKSLVQSFKEVAARALKAEFDVLEIHGAHGYLIHQFLSPLSNKRTDDYGGSFENRTRFLLEIIEKIKKVWPKGLPLFVRLSCTDWVDEEESWDMTQTIELSRLLYNLGVDLVDCSTGGSSPKQRIPVGPGFQVPYATELRNAIPGLLTGAVGLITDPELTNEVIRDHQADLVFIGREFLNSPSFVKHAALKLDTKIKWANQYEVGRPRPNPQAFKTPVEVLRQYDIIPESH